MLTTVALLALHAVSPAGAAPPEINAGETPAPPEINDLVPPVVQRGTENSLLVVGKEFAPDAELIVPFGAEIKRSSQGVETAAFSLKLANDLPTGVYPVRVRTGGGISNLRLLAVTDLPVVRGKEPNGAYKLGRPDLSQSQEITPPCIVTGGRLEREIDLYRFAVTAGQRLVFVTETRRQGLTPDPMLRLRDPLGRTLATVNDSPGLQRDERLDHTFTQAGDHYAELQSFGAGGWNNYYVLKIGDLDYAKSVFPLGGCRGETVKFTVTGRDGEASIVEAKVPDDPYNDRWMLPLEKFPGSLPWPMACGDLPEVEETPQRSEPQHVAWPVTINGRIGKLGEQDLYRIDVQPGQHVRIQVNAYDLCSSLDGHLMVYDPAGKKLLAQNDDQIGRGDPDPGLTFQVPENVSQVAIALNETMRHGGENFAYRLTIEAGGPDFYLWLGKAQDGRKTNEENEAWFRRDLSDTLNLPPGQEVPLRIAVRRDAKENDPHYNGPIQGYRGAIRLHAENVPPGVTVTPAVLAEGQVEGSLMCVASEEAPREPFEIVIVGEGTREDGSTIHRIAERKLFLSDPQMINLFWNWRVQKVTCVVTKSPQATASTDKP